MNCSSLNQSAFSSKKTGFFIKLCIVWLTLSCYWMSFISKSWILLFIFSFYLVLKKKGICHSLPLSLSNLLGLRFEVVKIFENSSVTVLLLLLSGGWPKHNLWTYQLWWIYIYKTCYLSFCNLKNPLNWCSIIHRCDYKIFF